MDQRIQRADKAIQQLDLRVNETSALDKLQIINILINILDYPDYHKAQDHATANTIGNYDLFETRSKLVRQLALKQQKQKVIVRNMLCECCGLFVHDETIPFCTPLENINIGLGARLYLNSLLYNAFLFFLATTIFSIYCIVTNLIACRDQSDSSCGLQGISLSYKIQRSDNYEDMLYTSSVLGIVLVSLWGIVQVIKNHHEKKIQIKSSKMFIQASEFTLMLSQFPYSLLRKDNKQNITYLQGIFDQYKQTIQSDKNYKIASVNVARNLYFQRTHNKQRIQALKEQMNEKKDIFRNWIIQRKYHNHFLATQTQRSEKYDQYFNFYIQKYDISQSYVRNQDENVILFITFQESKARQEIQLKTRTSNIMNFFNLCHKNQFPIEGIQICKAPPPQQIKWTHVGFPFKTKLLRIFLVYGVSLLFLAGSLATTYGLNQIQNSNPNIWISISISIIITLINFAIQFVIMFLSKYLQEITQSNVQFNIAFKICVFQILNVVGVPLLALYISKRNLYGKSGLSQDIFFIAIFNILPPLARFIDPWYLMIKVRNWHYGRPVYRLKHFDSQEEFNKIYEANDFDLGYEYAYILKTSIFTSFFMILQPIIALFAVIGLLLMFKVNKYRIFYRFFKPRFYSATVNNLVNYLSNLSPIIFGLGMLVFTNWQNQYYFSGNVYMNWVIFIVGGFFLIFPFKLLYRFIPEPQFPELFYSKQKPILPSEYDRMNPITKSQALNQHLSYLDQLELNKGLPDQAQLIKQSVIRKTANDLKKSRLVAEQFRNTLKNSRISKSPKAFNLSHVKQSQFADGIDKVLGEIDNMESYQNFANKRKDLSSI